MKLWPLESYEIETPLSVADILVRLQSITAASRPGRGAPISPFEGRVTEAAFVLRPVIYSSKSFVPELHGSFESHPAGTAVRVDMVPGRATLTILAVLVAFLAVSVYDHNTPRVLLTTGGFVLLGWVMSLAGFWLDGGRARQKLHDVLLPSSRPIEIAIDTVGYNPDAN